MRTIIINGSPKGNLKKQQFKNHMYLYCLYTFMPCRGIMTNFIQETLWHQGIRTYLKIGTNGTVTMSNIVEEQSHF